MSAVVPGLWEGCCAVRQQLTSYSSHLQRLVCKDMLGQPRRKFTFSSCLSPLETQGAALELESQLCNGERQSMLIKMQRVTKLWDTTSSLGGHIRMQNYLDKLKNCCSEWYVSPKHESRHRHCTKPREEMTDRQQSLQWVFCTRRDRKDNHNQQYPAVAITANIILGCINTNISQKFSTCFSFSKWNETVSFNPVWRFKYKSNSIYSKLTYSKVQNEKIFNQNNWSYQNKLHTSLYWMQFSFKDKIWKKCHLKRSGWTLAFQCERLKYEHLVSKSKGWNHGVPTERE